MVIVRRLTGERRRTILCFLFSKKAENLPLMISQSGNSKKIMLYSKITIVLCRKIMELEERRMSVDAENEKFYFNIDFILQLF